MKWHDLTREELYRRVWEKPAAQLKEEFEVSDVAIAKACKRMEIPKPPRGYWARLANGQKVKKTPLPKISKTLKLKLALETESSKKTSALDPLEDVERLENIPLPKNCRKLHPIAKELLDELNFVLPDERDHDLLATRSRPDLPQTKVSKNMLLPTVRCFHAILTTLESRGVEYKKSRSKYNDPTFLAGTESVSITIEEPIVWVTREPTDVDKRRPSWEWELRSQQPSGLLIFRLNTGSRYDRNSHIQISQKEDQPIEALTAKVVETIWEHFKKKRQSRIDEAIAHQRRMVEREKEMAKEAESEHHRRLAEATQTREQNLIWASQWWAITNTSKAFIDACEKHWLEESQTLSAEQLKWLAWARQYIESMPVANFSYPDPQLDGPFNPEAIDQGGPYPQTTKIPRPPTIPMIQENTKPEPLPPQSYTSQKPYPFWLKNQR